MKSVTYYLRIIRIIFSSIYFNFHYLPITQAIYLPILLYKPHFGKLLGNVAINGNIRFGMIRLGFPNISIYPNNGVNFEIKGGVLIFNESCFIGNNSSISINKNGICEIGKNFNATTSLKLVCHYHIKIEEDVLCGWETMIVDTDFHRLTCIENQQIQSYGFVKIGKKTWIAMKTTILKGTILPPYTVVGANSLCNKNYEIPEKSLIAGQPAVLKKEGVYLNRDDMNIVFDFSNRNREL